MAPPLEPPASEAGPAKSREIAFDAEEYLERTLPRQPGDFLKVFPMHNRSSFRVNWYSNHTTTRTTMLGLHVSYIRESKFLFCPAKRPGHAGDYLSRQAMMPEEVVQHLKWPFESRQRRRS